MSNQNYSYSTDSYIQDQPQDTLLEKFKHQSMELMDISADHNLPYLNLVFKEQLQKKIIQKNQSSIIQALYDHQKEMVLKKCDRENINNSSQNGGQSDSQVRQNKYSYSSTANISCNRNYINNRFEVGSSENQPSSFFPSYVNSYQKLTHLQDEAECHPQVKEVLDGFRTMLQDNSEKGMIYSGLMSFCEKYKMELRFESNEMSSGSGGNKGFIFNGVMERPIRHSRILFVCEALVSGLRHGTHLGPSKREAKSQASLGAIIKILVEEQRTYQRSLMMKSTPYLEFFLRFMENIKIKQQAKETTITNSFNSVLKMANNIFKGGNISNIQMNQQLQKGRESQNENNKENFFPQEDINDQRNYREELSIFAHKHLHLSVNWETVLETREKMWLAIASVGNLKERGFGKNKKIAKNEAAKILLQRCLHLSEGKKPIKQLIIQTVTQPASSDKQKDENNFSKQQKKELIYPPSQLKQDCRRKESLTLSQDQLDELISDCDEEQQQDYYIQKRRSM